MDITLYTGRDVEAFTHRTDFQQHNGSNVALAHLWSSLAGGGDAFSKRGLTAVKPPLLSH